jgi:hypothetical protein
MRPSGVTFSAQSSSEGEGDPWLVCVVAWAEWVCVSHRHMLQCPDGSSQGSVQSIINHEIVHEKPAALLERLVGVGVEGRDHRLRNLRGR